MLGKPKPKPHHPKTQTQYKNRTAIFEGLSKTQICAASCACKILYCIPGLLYIININYCNLKANNKKLSLLNYAL